MSTSPLTDLDPLLTAPKRLAIVSVLASSASTDFGFLRDHLGISDSDLSKQLSALEQAGYLSSSRTGRGRGSVASFRITRSGRAAFARHGTTLRALLGAQQPPVDDDFRQDADPR